MADYNTSLYPYPPVTCCNDVIITTPLNSNVVEWCPISSHSNLLLCGTYTLDTGFTRFGNIELYGWVTDDPFTLLNRYDEGAGVLDLKWLPYNTMMGTIFCTVNSIGQLNVYSMESGLFEFKRIQSLQVCEKNDGSELCLSFDWISCEDRSCILSDSLGRLAFLECCETGELVCSSQWKAHDYEAWIAASDNWSKHVVYSGGDDNRFKGWDLRSAGTPVFSSSQHFTGVCAIQSNPLREHLLATGSFDECLMIWDARNMTSPLSKVTLEDGGVWRLKWHPNDPNLLLAACTRAGAAVFDFRVSLSMPNITWYKGHGSLVYGVDWRRDETRNEVDEVMNQLGALTMDTDSALRHSRNCVSYQIASCSFYDRALHLWSIDRVNV